MDAAKGEVLWVSESAGRSLFLSTLVVGFGLAFALRLPPLSLLPADPEDVSDIVQSILQAQAAMMAISLAVMAFLVGGVRHEDIDDPLYEWFLRKAYVRPVFALTVLLTMGTTVAFVVTEVWDMCGVPNLTLFAGCSILLAMTVIVGFAFRALNLLRPGQYRTLKEEVTAAAVTEGADAYADFLREVHEGKAPDGGQQVEKADEANRAVQRVMDDAERAVHRMRYTDFRDALAILEQSLELAVSRGTLRQAPGSAPDPPDAAMPWPTGLVVVRGLLRVDGLCLRDGLSDYLESVRYLRQWWLGTAISHAHARALEAAAASLYRQYDVARRESSDGDRREVSEQARRLLFSNLRHIRSHVRYALTPAERQPLACVLLNIVQRYIGGLLEQGDHDAACDWLDDLSRYLSMQRLSGAEQREFTSRMAGGPSLQAYARIAGMSVAGRALELDAGPVLDHLKNQWLMPDSSAFPADATAGDLTWVPNDIGRITASWQSGTLGRTGAAPNDWRAAFLNGRYALVFYLWMSAHLVEGEALRDHTPDDEDVVQALRGLWSEYGNGMLDTLYSGGEQAHEARQRVDQWLDTGSAPG